MGTGLAARDVLLQALSQRAPTTRHAPEIDTPMKVLRIVLGDQLSAELTALSDLDPGRDIILMMEVQAECIYVRHHKQKIVMVLAAMRHFADTLRMGGATVDYVKLDAADNSGSFTTEVQRAVARHRPTRMVITEPSEWRVQEMVNGWGSLTATPIEVRVDDRYFASRQRFAAWAGERRSWRMEHFYRDMRREHHILLEGELPAGGAWNYDQDNRKRLPAGMTAPGRRRFPPDTSTRGVMALVEQRFPDHFGELEEFGWPVTRADALLALQDFIAHGLPCFGDYQDAMRAGEAFLFHSLLAPALNIGLLSPREVCQAAEAAWSSGAAPLNAVEGFVRQILGWREYVRGVYWTLMPDYADRNALHATRRLPAFYWTGDTPMACLREAVGSTRRHAYSHHIQRLMVTGNFALLAGVAPHEIERWYLAVYADAFEWVEMPNTLGMAVFADGGQMASKPYAAAGAYINRMSDFCGSCSYDVRHKTGANACPFNYLYWAFLIRQKSRLAANPRMAMPYRTLASWSHERQLAILTAADAFLAQLDADAQ